MEIIDGFSRNKVFYPHVMSYLATYHGAMDLVWRGLFPKMKAILDEEKLLKQQNSEESKCGLEELQLIKAKLIDDSKLWDYSKSVKDLPFQIPFGTGLQLSSNVDKQYLEIDINSLVTEFGENVQYLLKFILPAASHLLISAHDSTENIRTKDELWEFLRHCRNAAAHGKFNFKYGEPLLPARWRSLEITKELQGQNLFFDGNSGFLKPADPIYLLQDIEKSLTSENDKQDFVRFFGEKK